MCGIAGLVCPDSTELAGAIERMTTTLCHRGPDDSGTAVFEEQHAALGMRRLSIVDIEGGRQPMWDERHRYCLVFNGEIYNAPDLRTELLARGHVFRSHHSDTEALVHGFEEWGARLFHRLNGMFAIAVWDRAEARMTIARDRFGKKPLYVAALDDGFAIASELKALFAAPGFPSLIDPTALTEYLSFDFVLAPRSILAGVTKLPAGHYAQLTESSYDDHAFWTPSFGTNKRPLANALEDLDDNLNRAVRRRMVADVPVGLFLSGGLDSTTIGYYMRLHHERVMSFSIGFGDPKYDESAYADAAARALGTEHHLERFNERDIEDLVLRVPEILDEPMGDQSILPTYLVSKVAHSHVKVALAGDGSDELLMGYKAYRPLKVASWFDRTPPVVAGAVAWLAQRAPRAIAGRPLRGVAFARRLELPPAARLLSHLSSFHGDGSPVLSPDVRDAATFDESLSDVAAHLSAGASDSLSQAVAGYLRGYLQEDILVKVDRASMATSLEVRAPFLDPHVADTAMSLPHHQRMRGFTGKYVLRRLMRGRIPDSIIDRPKVGFGVPLNDWLRSSLRTLLTDSLSSDLLREAGIFNPVVVERLLREHLQGTADHGHKLWLLLQFELWRNRWGVAGVAPS